jgi:hypothetical protein
MLIIDDMLLIQQCMGDLEVTNLEQFNDMYSSDTDYDIDNIYDTLNLDSP